MKPPPTCKKDPPKRLKDPMDQYTVRRALALVGKGDAIWSDDDVPGLAIRIRSTSATWALTGRLGDRQSTWTIGPVSDVSLRKAEEYAKEAKRMLRGNADPTAWLREQTTGVVAPAPAPPEPVVPDAPVRPEGVWSWEEGRDAFLENTRKHRSKATYEGYKRTLNSADVKPLEGKWLTDLVGKDVRRCQESAWDRDKLPQAHLVLRTIKSCMSWLCQKSESGIEDSVAAGVTPLDPGKLETTGKGFRLGWVPTVEEIGKLAWTLSKHTGTPLAMLAAALTLFTVQRIETVLSAQKSAFIPKLEGGLWDISPPFMKSKRRHLLPLSGTAWHIVQLAMQLSPPDCPFLFPQTRERRKGAGMNGHLSMKAVRSAMKGMGRHSLRRAFATYGMAFLGFELKEIKGILDHLEGSGGDVTLERYELSDGQHYKWRLMRLWEAWVLKQVSNQAPKDSLTSIPPFLTFVPVRDRALDARLAVWVESANEASQQASGVTADREPMVPTNSR